MGADTKSCASIRNKGQAKERWFKTVRSRFLPHCQASTLAELNTALDIYLSSNSKAVMVKTIKQEIINLVCEKKRKVVLVVDEASLMRLEVFAELHTLCQFEQDAKPWLPMILVGQASLVDKLSFRSSQPLASRIIAKCHLEGVDLPVLLNLHLNH